METVLWFLLDFLVEQVCFFLVSKLENVHASGEVKVLQLEFDEIVSSRQLFVVNLAARRGSLSLRMKALQWTFGFAYFVYQTSLFGQCQDRDSKGSKPHSSRPNLDLRYVKVV